MYIDTLIANGIRSCHNVCLKPFVKLLHRHIDTVNVIAIASFSILAVSLSPPLFLIGAISGIVFGQHDSATIKTIHDIFVSSVLNEKMSIVAFTAGMGILTFCPTLISPISGWVAGQSLTNYKY